MNPKITCSGCSATWTALTWAHCSVCHATFTGSSLYDVHRQRGKCWGGHTPGTATRRPQYVNMTLESGVWSSPEGHLRRKQSRELQEEMMVGKRIMMAKRKERVS